ncbi:sulfatase-like hydrolase/transferase [Microvirga massiliensis]|uniref:sulfatase-like hydrolase/transferase n=1 Tax=Microvirga massiliensis TaxID=1033741 RepID=UPI000AD33BC6|nr:sulfatase-like hydrolase/transferase [Microvirga massiliensis]
MGGHIWRASLVRDWRAWRPAWEEGYNVRRSEAAFDSKDYQELGGVTYRNGFGLLDSRFDGLRNHRSGVLDLDESENTSGTGHMAEHTIDRRSVLLGMAGAASLSSQASAQTTATPGSHRAGTGTAGRQSRPNILILCMDQWQTHMQVPNAVQFPAMRRLEGQGVSFDRQYCTVPICTPSRATMWTGVHAKHTGLWDNTNFAWIGELSRDIPTIGHMLRDRGYHTAFKGKWHLSDVPAGEDALESYGFSDYQQWGDMFGATLQGEKLDDTVAFEAIDWLEHKALELDQPWLLVCSLVNPHDIMYLRTDPVQAPNPNGMVADHQSAVQRLGWFQQQWDVDLPANFADDYRLQPYGARSYKENADLNYGRIPDARRDLWLKHRNYLINCTRLADAQFTRVLDAVDRLNLWQDTVVILTEDHGEMNGAHRTTQKGGTAFDEAAIVNLTVCAPGGLRGRHTAAVGSHLDLAPTLLAFAGLGDREIQERYPHLKGRSLLAPVLDPDRAGPRGSASAPGDGALVCWDGLNSLDNDWVVTGALKATASFTSSPSGNPELAREQAEQTLREVGQKFGAPDFSKRTFFRAVVDRQHKLVRWFSPEEYGNPSTFDELYAHSDVALYDLVNDPGELENLAHPDHPDHDRELVERMLAKLHALVSREIGEDRAPFSLDLFGTRQVKYR